MISGALYRSSTSREMPEPPDAVLMYEPLAAFNTLTATWNVSRRIVAAGRVFDRNVLGLGSLSMELGVTRERVHELQIQLECRVRHWLHTDEQAGRPFLGHLLAIEARFGTVATETELRRMHSDHDQPIHALGTPLWRAIATLLPHRTWARDWLVTGDLEERLEETRAVLAGYGHAGIPWVEAKELLRGLGIRYEIAPQWIDRVGGFWVVNGQLRSWVG